MLWAHTWSMQVREEVHQQLCRAVQPLHLLGAAEKEQPMHLSLNFSQLLVWLSQSQSPPSVKLNCHIFPIIPYLHHPHRSSDFPGSSHGKTILWCILIYLFINRSFPCGFDLSGWLQNLSSCQFSASQETYSLPLFLTVGKHTPASIFSWDWLVDQWNLGIQLPSSQLVQLQADGPGQERREVVIIIWEIILKKKKKTEGFWGISIMLKEVKVGSQVVILTFYCMVQKIVIY